MGEWSWGISERSLNRVRASGWEASCLFTVSDLPCNLRWLVITFNDMVKDFSHGEFRLNSDFSCDSIMRHEKSLPWTRGEDQIKWVWCFQWRERKKGHCLPAERMRSAAARTELRMEPWSFGKLWLEQTHINWSQRDSASGISKAVYWIWCF